MTYRLAQLATTAALWDEQPWPRSWAGWVRLTVTNALTESGLIILRALVGFVLAESNVPKGRVRPRDAQGDVRPSWFDPSLRENWSPPEVTAVALRTFYDTASGAVAHAAIRSDEHPGCWPMDEALLVLTGQLRAFHELLSPDMRQPLAMVHPDGRTTTLLSMIESIEGIGLGPYNIPTDAKPSTDVATCRAALRDVLGWPPAELV